MSGQLSFGLADLYGSQMGFYQTRAQTVPEADDQMALVDDQDLAAANPHNVDPAKHKKVFISVAVVVAIIILLNIRF